MKSYNKFYYDNNKDKISIKREAKKLIDYHDFHGHVKLIHDPIRRYASQWHIPIDSLKKFKRWALNDATYEELFKAWEESGFDKNLAPVVMRRVKKQGFIISNLYWSTKGQHAWWNGLLDDIKDLSGKMEQRQAKNNKMTDIEREEMRKLFKKVKK